MRATTSKPPKASHVDDKAAKRRLQQAAALSPEALLAQYGTSPEGLTESAVQAQRQALGENRITKQHADGAAKRLLNAFVNPFTVVLFVLAAISLVTDVILMPAGQKDPSSVVIVVVMVLISGILRFAQESRSGKAAQKLSEMVQTTIAVRRAGQAEAEQPIDQLVAGDVVVLAAGDMVPADLRILSAKDLFVAQASLTGESEPVEKLPGAVADAAEKDPLQLPNLAFLGSDVVSGSATAVVVNVGDATVFGALARGLSGKKPPTSFEKGINAVSWVLIRFMLVMVPIVFAVSGLRSHSWMDAFLFALSVAVGLTPAMLPTIVAAGLARGATALSKKKVIVKDLNAIQNFGAMDILCTDKTGTLTQDKVSLMYSLNVAGNQDERVLRHAFLNSHFQTGLRNLMDVAVLDYAEAHEKTDGWKQYKKMDEVPFDFARRRMSVVVEDPGGKSQMITKGAIEEMLAVCSYADFDDGAPPKAITPEMRAAILARVQGYNQDGMRVLGIAHKAEPPGPGAFGVQDEKDMVLIGFLAFLDPPKDSAAAAVQALHGYGVDVKILTGDNDAVTRAVCRKVGIPAEHILLGADVEHITDDALDALVEGVSVFAKLSPQQKARVVAALRRRGHTVGYMGDGINDAAAMKQADVGISVDTAVDVAKESANLILLDKDLGVLKDGIVEGRKTYANIIKYIKMTVSSNFGNMLSVLTAACFLPFLPMLPLQILVLNLIYDISCIAIPWDHVDPEYLLVPRKWEADGISKFMLWLGPVSSVFDITTYLALFFWLCPLLAGGGWHGLSASQQALFITVFHTGWFVESLWTQTLVIHMIRTPKVPFVQSRASWQVLLFTTGGIAVGTLLPYTPVGPLLGMAALPAVYYLLLAATILCYITLATVMKKLYIRRYGELL